jgi:hypothetical protein
MVSIEKVGIDFFFDGIENIDDCNLVETGNNGPVRSFQRTFTCAQTATG